MYDDIFKKLSKSEFRSRFKLKEKDRKYFDEKGFDVIKSHAEDFIKKRIAPAYIPNDGKQTPTKGHPVFTAQYATATCCRSCINKWHKFPKDVELSEKQQEYLVDLIMEWLKRQVNNGI